MACRTARPKRELVRVVRLPDWSVAFDPTGRMSGRGAYLCADGSCWQTALAKGAIGRALGTALPPELRERLAAGPGGDEHRATPTTNMTMTMTKTMTTTGGDERGEE